MVRKATEKKEGSTTPIEESASKISEAAPAVTAPAEADPIDEKLKEVGIKDLEIIRKIKEDFGAETVDDLSLLTKERLMEYGMKEAPAIRAINALKTAKPTGTAPTAAVPVASAMNATVSLENILPVVPADDSWLLALKTGGVLKIDESTVISAIRAALAHRVGLYDIPGILATKMETFAESNEEQAPVEIFGIRKQLIKRNYAEIFEAIDGLDGTFVTEKRKNMLFSKIDKSLWPAISSFYNQLKSWQEAWMQGAANPAIMVTALLSASGGIGAVPAGMMQPPDTGVLRDSADAVSDAINKIFAGFGVQIAAALAFEATKIRDTLMNPRIPALIGAANRDQMLRQLEVAIPATYPRMEQNLTRFVLAILQVKDLPAGNEELQYFTSLCMLGSQIPWDQLTDQNGLKTPTGIGGTLRNGL